MSLTHEERRIIKEAWKLWGLERDLKFFAIENGKISESDRAVIKEKLEAMAKKKGFSLIELEEKIKQFHKMIDEL